MTVRVGQPKAVRMREMAGWDMTADSPTRRLARDFAREAWGNSRKLHTQFGELERLVGKIAAGEGGERPYYAVEELVSLMLDDAVGIAAEIGVETHRRFRPDDIWRAMVTDYVEWAQDWAEPLDQP